MAMPLLLTFCGHSPVSGSVSEVPRAVERSSTPTGFLPISTVATTPVVMANGMTFQAVVVTKPSLCGDREVATTAFVYGASGSIVSTSSSSTSGRSTCSTLLPPVVSGVAVVAGANAVSHAIVRGSDTMASAVDNGLETASDNLQSVGEGLTENVGQLSNSLALLHCQSLGSLANIKACIAALNR